ncbi:MAG: hypothetical protein SWK76_17085 [Actinomycetota bacterium]|nr:hypothetical protein [Actinomycetota bacterium]
MAAKHRESYQHKIARLERENASLREQLERLKDAQRFLPPESFCSYYGLLLEAVYLTKQPEPEVKTHEMRRRGARWPVRNYGAYKKLRKIDQSLYDLKREIYGFLSREG